MATYLSNEVLLLRAPEPEDLEFLYNWENDTSNWTNGNTLVPYSRFTLKEHITNAGKDIFETRQLRLIVVEIDKNWPIGVIDLYEFDPFNQRAGVGILIDTLAQRKGFGTHALNLLKTYAFEILGLKQLHAVIPIGNASSQALFKNCNFHQSGVLEKWNKNADGFQDVLIFQCFS